MHLCILCEQTSCLCKCNNCPNLLPNLRKLLPDSCKNNKGVCNCRPSGCRKGGAHIIFIQTQSASQSVIYTQTHCLGACTHSLTHIWMLMFCQIRPRGYSDFQFPWNENHQTENSLGMKTWAPLPRHMFSTEDLIATCLCLMSFSLERIWIFYVTVFLLVLYFFCRTAGD